MWFWTSGRSLYACVRGNPRCPQRRPMCYRFICACAGEPGRQKALTISTGVYLRVCGGTPEQQNQQLAGGGLSARVRGNQEDTWATQPATRVYLRVCGGTAGRILQPETGSGLSPRVRGNPAASLGDGREPGSIPACAGEPSYTAPATSATPVYPRVCGGTVRGVATPLHPGGLSPRVRGNQPGNRALAAHTGSIPACAGEPRGAGGPLRDGTVYPRVCGGTLLGN